MNLFEGKQIRQVWDKTNGKHWFSTIDICAALRDCDYKTARNYWKWLKNKFTREDNQPVSVYRQLKMQAADGKLRYTDVMDAEEVAVLIKRFPSPKAEAFKVWIVDLEEEKAEVVKSLVEAVTKAKDRIRCRAAGLLMTIYWKEYDVLGEDVLDGDARLVTSEGQGVRQPVGGTRIKLKRTPWAA